MELSRTMGVDYIIGRLEELICKLFFEKKIVITSNRILFVGLLPRVAIILVDFLARL